MTQEQSQKSSLLQELASSRKTLEEENQQLREQLAKANETIAKLREEASAFSTGSNRKGNETGNGKIRTKGNKRPVSPKTGKRNPAAPKKSNNHHLWVVPAIKQSTLVVTA